MFHSSHVYLITTALNWALHCLFGDLLVMRTRCNICWKESWWASTDGLHAVFNIVHKRMIDEVGMVILGRHLVIQICIKNMSKPTLLGCIQRDPVFLSAVVHWWPWTITIYNRIQGRQVHGGGWTWLFRIYSTLWRPIDWRAVGFVWDEGIYRQRAK